MEQYDRVKFADGTNAPIRLDNPMAALNTAAECYMKTRAALELLDSARAAIARHIRSYEGWEYFIDAFNTEGPKPYWMFNTVRVYSNGNGNDLVELLHEPLGYRHDANNILFGTCSFKDVLDIERIIWERKEACNG